MGGARLSREGGYEQFDFPVTGFLCIIYLMSFMAYFIFSAY